MPKHVVNWVSDHTQICDRLHERVQLMQDYLDGKPKLSGNRTELLGALSAGVQLPGHRARHRIQTRFCVPDIAQTLDATRRRNEV